MNQNNTNQNKYYIEILKFNQNFQRIDNNNINEIIFSI
jgi:hypothetical protein